MKTTPICCTLKLSVVVAFIRKYTHLSDLADLLEAGAHEWSAADLKAWCEQRGIMLRDPNERRRA